MGCPRASLLNEPQPQGRPGNGLLLFFRVDDFDRALPRARALVSRLDEEPHVNPSTGTMEFSLRDPDGYYVTISALSEQSMEEAARPVACAQMLIRRPVAEVYSAFVDPRITERFWFTRGDAVLKQGATVTWQWEMYGATAEVQVIALDRNRRILIHWPTPVEWVFSPRGEQATLVTITASGFEGTPNEQAGQAIDSMGGFSLVLAACKAWLEHGIQLNLTADHNPDHQMEGWNE